MQGAGGCAVLDGGAGVCHRSSRGCELASNEADGSAGAVARSRLDAKGEMRDDRSNGEL